MRRKRRNRQRKLIIIISLSLLFILTAGYAAFQTNLNITAKGNILEKGITPLELKNNVVTIGDGLYKDTYESGRYIYRGAEPNNYIIFNDELWRILSVESDGTLKIIRNESIGNMSWDAKNTRDSSTSTYCTDSSVYGCNAWGISGHFVNGSLSGTVTQDASLNTYLNNDYYNNLSVDAKTLIQPHTWAVGGLTYNNSNLLEQIASEKKVTWTGKIALMTLSEFIRANTNTEQCGNYSLINTNYSVCKTTNYIVPITGYLWTISPDASFSRIVFDVSSDGNSYRINAYNDLGVLPALYLTPDILITGEGTLDKPFIIK